MKIGTNCFRSSLMWDLIQDFLVTASGHLACSTELSIACDGPWLEVVPRRCLSLSEPIHETA